jgi:hypothetical protein
MQNRTFRSVVLLSALVASTAGSASVALAQMVDPGSPQAMMGRAAARGPDMNKPAIAPPPALPGAASRSDAVAPATKLGTDMSPNEALFDAIDRGDIAAARDAMSRGADLGAHNVLGMTPMELSVDLGRNDISFLLLSYRTTDSSPRATAQAQPNAVAPGAAPKAAAVKSAPRVQVVPVKEVVPTAPQTPRLFANDGGTAVPNAGFLGFGTGR